MVADRQPEDDVALDERLVVAHVLRQARRSRVLVRRVAGDVALVRVERREPKGVADESGAAVV
jgi:hypothetical protein